jgi:Zn-dependent membrane protease YugP
MILDQYWLVFAIPGILIGLYAQAKLSSAYGRYSRVGVLSGFSGAEAAREILDRGGLHQVTIREVRGHLSDHYDPLKRQLCLSTENFHGRSIAAVGVAAHEAGHALQHAAAYGPLKWRMALVPVTSFASNAAIFLVFGGVLLGLAQFALLGVIAYAIISLFQLVTLPVEYDASRRAKAMLQQLGIVQTAEAPQVARVLNAAALTYVAALVAAVMQLLHLLLIARGFSRD